jgi:N-terminal domain of molybdenum-binding protein
MQASLAIIREGELFLGQNQIRLLRQVLTDGSIHAAAMNLRMSYQHAWHLLDKLNRLSPIPVLVRKKGGRDGGGCSISPYGIKLIEMYAKKESELLIFLEQSSSDFDGCFF